MSSRLTKAPSPRWLMMLGLTGLAIVGLIVGGGMISRAQKNRELAQWTAEQAIPTVVLANLERGNAYEVVTLPGMVQPYNKATIHARVNGYLKSWSADIGAHVKAGQVLGLIDAPDLDQQLAQAKATLANAKANADIAALDAHRYSLLLKDQVVARQTVDDSAAAAVAKKATMVAAQALVRQLEAMESFKSIIAPFDGTVTARNTDVGVLINSGGTGQPLFEVSDLHRVRIYVQVPQTFSAGLTPGLRATLDMPQYDGQRFDATVVATSNAMDQASRTMQVELQADNPDGKLLGGAYCNVHFQIPSDPNFVRVPATALISGGREVMVAALSENNKVVLKPVQIRRDLGDSVEIASGLTLAERVIDSPPETLRAGDSVRLAGPAQKPATVSSTQ